MPADCPRYRAWLAAENQAQEAESELSAAMLQAATGLSSPPSSEMVLLAQAKRASAHSLLQEAMQELKAGDGSLPAIVTSHSIRPILTLEQLSGQAPFVKGRDNSEAA